MLTEPFLAPIRKLLPPMGGLDFSPLILLFLLRFIRGMV
jgi:YggT family protein